MGCRERLARVAEAATRGTETHDAEDSGNRHPAPNAQMGQPGTYGSPGNMTPGYSSTARHKPADTNGGGGGQ